MEQALSFEGTGLDLDNNYATINPGDSPFRLNCRYGTSHSSDLGGIQNFNGNTRINLKYEGGIFFQPPGTNEVIGSCKDPERNAIIYFVWNSNNLHQIRRYYTQTNVVQVILESPVLNFQRTHKISHANVVDKYLSWTDGWVDHFNELNYNAPRQIDMDKAYGFMLNLPFPQGYTTIDIQTIDAIRYAPGLCPTFNYVNDLNFNDNRLYGNLFQFGYRWVYYDNSKSVISPLSKLTLPQGEDIEGNYNLTTENRIDVTLQTGHYTVVRIELVVRQGTSWKIVDEIEKYDGQGNILIPSGSTHTVQFFNTKFIAEIPIEEALRPFDYLPQTADTQEIISAQQGARRIYGSYTEGYANVPDFDMSVEVKIEKIDPASPNYKNITFKRKGAYIAGTVYADKAGRKAFVQTTEASKAVIPWWRSTELIAEYYDPADEWIISTHQKPYIEWQLNSAPPAWAETYQIVCTKDINNQQRLFTFYNFGATVGDKDLGRFKVGQRTIYIPPQIGYEYQEGDRIRIVAQFDNTNNPNVDGPNSSVGFGLSGQGGQPYMKKLQKLGVIHPLITPTPSTPYQVHLMQTYNLPVGPIFDSRIDKFDTSTQRITIDDEFQIIDTNILYLFEIYNPQNEIAEANQNFFEVGETYPIVNGQHSVTSGRIDGIDVFVGNRKYEFTPIPFIFSVYKWSYRRKNEPDTPQFFYIPGVEMPTSSPNLLEATFLSAFTAFRPYGENSQAQQFNTYTIDNSPIIGANTSDNRGDMNGTYPVWVSTYNGIHTEVSALPERENFWDTLANPFTQNTLYYGQLGADARLIIKSPNVKFDVFGIITESQSYSQYYPSEVDQTGRPYVINKEAVRRKYFADLIFGGQFFDNTLLNFFSRYESQNVVKLNERYNQITRLQEVGFMLKVRQQNKSTSIYVGRSELTNTDGTSNVAASNSVLGTINPSDEVWGGTHPMSDTKSIRDTYFFDYINGVVVRDATNGLVAISGNLASPQDPYRMTSFFRDMSEWISENMDIVEIHGAWDNNTQSYFFTVRQLKPRGEFNEVPAFVDKYRIREAWDNGLTISFHESSNRWQTFHNFVPEHFASIGQAFVSFVGGEAFLHYSNAIKNHYYGQTFDTVTAQICNQATNNIKVFDNMEIHSNDKWYANGSPYGDDIFILPNAQFPDGMRSKLDAIHFKGKEGKWNASMLRDINTPGFTNQTLSLVGGRRLRGDAMKVTLRNRNQNAVFLRQLIMHFTPSEMSG